VNLESTRWHALTIEAALAALNTERTGLSDEAAAARLFQFGPNRLTPPEPVPALVILRDQLTSVVVFLLVAASVISLLF
jgi:magnesium-transporting ATPase (P-type)